MNRSLCLKVLSIGFVFMLAAAVHQAGAEDGHADPSGRGLWEIGPEAYYYSYEEAPFMELDGWKYGVAGRYTRYIMLDQMPLEGEAIYPGLRPLRGPHFAIRLDARYAEGDERYDGQLMDGTPYVVRGIPTKSYEGRVLAGLVWPQRDRMTSFYLGYGYRFKEDDSSIDRAGYKRESSYSYIPIVFELRVPVRIGTDLAWSFEYDYFIRGRQRSDLRDHGLPHFTHRQNEGHGFRGSIAWSGEWGRVGWVVEPFVRYWSIKGSEPTVDFYRDFVLLAWEPKNDTLEIGMNARLQF